MEYHLDTSLAADVEETLDPFELAYIEAAMWLLFDDDGHSLDYLGLHDVSPETVFTVREDCQDFRNAAGALLDGADPAQAGHDFWLTRNHHGAGFWDRASATYPNDPSGEQLTTLAHQAGEVDWYVDDQGKVCQS